MDQKRYVVYHMARRHHVSSIGISNPNAKLLFKGHDQFYTVQSHGLSEPLWGIIGN